MILQANFYLIKLMNNNIWRKTNKLSLMDSSFSFFLSLFSFYHFFYICLVSICVLIDGFQFSCNFGNCMPSLQLTFTWKTEMKNEKLAKPRVQRVLRYAYTIDSNTYIFMVISSFVIVANYVCTVGCWRFTNTFDCGAHRKSITICAAWNESKRI